MQLSDNTSFQDNCYIIIKTKFVLTGLFLFNEIAREARAFPPFSNECKFQVRRIAARELVHEMLF